MTAAASAGKIEVIEMLVKMGMDVNHRYNGKPVLHAALMGGVKTVQKLLDLGADVNILSEDGITALMEANWYGYDLLSNGANIKAMDNDGYTALKYASLLNNARGITTLIDFGADLRARSSDGACILASIISCEYGRPEAVELLIQQGADLDHPDDRGFVPLMIAALKNATQHIEVLLRYAPVDIASICKALAVALLADSKSAFRMLVEHCKRTKMPRLAEFIKQVR